jgi:hypothetical protein
MQVKRRVVQRCATSSNTSFSFSAPDALITRRCIFT